MGRPRKSRRRKPCDVEDFLTNRRDILSPEDAIYGLGGPTGAVYVLKSGPVVKIGFSAKPSMRVITIQTAMPHPVHTHWAVRMLAKQAEKIERAVHKSMKGGRFHAMGEWYYLSPQAAIGLIEVEIKRHGFEAKPDLRFGLSRTKEAQP